MKGDCRIWYELLLEKNGSCTSELLCWKREERDESSESEMRCERGRTCPTGLLISFVVHTMGQGRPKNRDPNRELYAAAPMATATSPRWSASVSLSRSPFEFRRLRRPGRTSGVVLMILNFSEGGTERVYRSATAACGCPKGALG